MKLFYLTPLTFPSRYANRLQVMKMTAAFSRFVDVQLYIARWVEREQVFREYAIRDTFPVKEIGEPRWCVRSLSYARKLLLYIHANDEEAVWYVRDVLMTFFLTFLSTRFRHNYFFELHTLTRFPRFMYRRILRNARGIITTNEKKKDDIVRVYSVDPACILVFGNGIDLEEFAALPTKESARRMMVLEVKKPLIVYTGTVARAYGTDVIEHARGILQAEAEFIIVSGKPRGTALLHIAAADIVVAPYLDENDHFRYYMSPMKLKEYMAADKPIVVSDLPAVREIVAENTAFFVPAGNVDAFVEMIRYVIAHPEEAAAKAHVAREAVRKFSWDKRAEAIIEFIKARENELAKSFLAHH